jgi:WD40 repeat protein
MRLSKLMARICVAITFTCIVTIALAAEPGGRKPPATDLYGDPLPPHALLRLGTTRFHHQAFIQDAAFSPDGRTLVSAAVNQDTAIALWEVPSGRNIRRFSVQSGDQLWSWSNAVAFCPDGKKVLSGDRRGTLHLWNIATGDEVCSIVAHPEVSAVAFSADGGWFASGGKDGVVRVWNTESGRELLSFDNLSPPQQMPGGGVAAARGDIAAVAFSPDANFLAVGFAYRQAKTGKIHIWDVQANKPVISFDDSYNTLVSLVFTPDGMQLISGGNRHVPRETFGKPYPALNVAVAQLREWDAHTGKMLRKIGPPELEAGAGAIALSSDGRTLVAGYENRILVFDFPSGNVRRSIQVPKWYGDLGLAISRNGDMVCAPLDDTIGLWNTETGDLILPRPESHTSFVGDVAYANDGSFIVTSGDSTVRAWDPRTGRQKWSRSLGGHASVFALALSADDTLIAAGGPTEHGEGGVRILRPATGEEVRFIPMYDKLFYVRQVRGLQFSLDASLLAIAHDRLTDDTSDIDLYDIGSGQRRSGINVGFAPNGSMMSFAPSGRSLYVTGTQAVVSNWDVATGERQREFTVLKPPPAADDGKKDKAWLAHAAFSPDLKILVTSQGRELVVWDVERGEMIAAIASERTEKRGHSALSRDGRFFVMSDLLYGGDPGSDDIRVFDLRSQRPITTFESSSGRASSFAFSRDGTRLVTGMSDGTALVWDLTTAIKSSATE